MTLFLRLFVFLFCFSLSTAQAEKVAHDPAEVMTLACHYQWQQYEWPMGNTLAQSVTHYSEGIKRICQAKAELYLEGYQIDPKIGEDDQSEISRLVFLPDVESIKQQVKQYLPTLQII